MTRNVRSYPPLSRGVFLCRVVLPPAATIKCPKEARGPETVLARMKPWGYLEHKVVAPIRSDKAPD